MLHPFVQQLKDKVESSSLAVQWMYEKCDWESIHPYDLMPRETYFDVNAQEYRPVEQKPYGW